MTAVALLQAELRAACRARILGLSGIPEAFHWEGEAFEAQIGVPFLREKLMPTGNTVRGLGVGGVISHNHLLLLTLFYPSGQGTTDIELAAGRLLEGFAPGREPLLYGSTSATIMQAEPGDLSNEPDWVRTAIRITTLAFTAT